MTSCVLARNAGCALRVRFGAFPRVCGGMDAACVEVLVEAGHGAPEVLDCVGVRALVAWWGTKQFRVPEVGYVGGAGAAAGGGVRRKCWLHAPAWWAGFGVAVEASGLGWVVVSGRVGDIVAGAAGSEGGRWGAGGGGDRVAPLDAGKESEGVAVAGCIAVLPPRGDEGVPAGWAHGVPAWSAGALSVPRCFWARGTDGGTEGGSPDAPAALRLPSSSLLFWWSGRGTVDDRMVGPAVGRLTGAAPHVIVNVWDVLWASMAATWGGRGTVVGGAMRAATADPVASRGERRAESRLTSRDMALVPALTAAVALDPRCTMLAVARGDMLKPNTRFFLRAVYPDVPAPSQPCAPGALRESPGSDSSDRDGASAARLSYWTPARAKHVLQARMALQALNVRLVAWGTSGASLTEAGAHCLLTPASGWVGPGAVGVPAPPEACTLSPAPQHLATMRDVTSVGVARYVRWIDAWGGGAQGRPTSPRCERARAPPLFTALVTPARATASAPAGAPSAPRVRRSRCCVARRNYVEDSDSGGDSGDEGQLDAEGFASVAALADASAFVVGGWPGEEEDASRNEPPCGAPLVAADAGAADPLGNAGASDDEGVQGGPKRRRLA